jgi:hypothetical protein
MPGQVHPRITLQGEQPPDRLLGLEPYEPAAAHGLLGRPNDPTGDGDRFVEQPLDVDLDNPVPEPGHAARGERRRPLEIVGIVAGDRGLSRQHRHDGRRETRLEERNQLVADAIPRNGRVLVRSVIAKRHGAGLEHRPEIGAGSLKERPHDEAGSRVHRAQSAGTGTAQQAQQEGLGLVVARVAHRNSGRAQAGGSPAKESMPRVVGRLLHRHPTGACPCSNVDPLQVERHPVGGGEPAAEVLVPVRVRPPELMIEMGCAGHEESVGLGNLLQNQEQRDRIGAARQRDDHARARRKQSMLAEGPAYGREDRHCLGHPGARRSRPCADRPLAP